MLVLLGLMRVILCGDVCYVLGTNRRNLSSIFGVQLYELGQVSFYALAFVFGKIPSSRLKLF
jgi:hypothetical protein